MALHCDLNDFFADLEEVQSSNLSSLPSSNFYSPIENKRLGSPYFAEARLIKAIIAEGLPNYLN